MNNKTIVSFFSGGGGFDIGAMLAEFTPIAAYEYIPEIAEVYRRNLGDHVNVMSILDVDPQTVPDATLYHFSPPCPNFSNAKKDKGETENDLNLARKVVDIIEAKRPLYVTLENVYGYRKSKSFEMILEALKANGYLYDWWHLNAANYGVPQTRKRLIMVARRDGKKPTRPQKTHDKNPAPLLAMMGIKKWVGWYEAIADLIPTLPPSKFANWQLKKLPKWFNYGESVLLEQSTGGDRDVSVNKETEPSGTITTGKGGRVSRAFLLHTHSNSNSDAREGDQPSFTIASGNQPDTDFVMNAANPNGNEKKKYREQDEPIKTITSGDSTSIKAWTPTTQGNIRPIPHNEPIETLRSKNTHTRTAFIIQGGNANSARPIDGSDPSMTIGDVNRAGNIPRAFLAPCDNTTNNKTLDIDAPSNTLVSSLNRKIPIHRAGINGRVIRLTIPALARLQAFPDWYEWPTKEVTVKMVINGGKTTVKRHITIIKKTLSCTIIGNSVPPLMAYHICKSLK